MGWCTRGCTEGVDRGGEQRECSMTTECATDLPARSPTFSRFRSAP